MTKPSLPQGTRDFGPETVYKRNYITDTITAVFRVYGFEPLETPAMENLDTLMGKYGDEGDKLIFKILNNGLDNPEKEKQLREDFEKVLQGKNSKGITERALKYDLTIPFARYVAMNHAKLVMPFKRYQVQPVWRADRPQKGRYREFYQCDADVVGSTSLLHETELALIYRQVFVKLGLKSAQVKINHRKILAALAEITAGPSSLTDITVAIDKLDKIGAEKVKDELLSKGLSGDHINVILQYLSISGSPASMIEQVKKLVGATQNGKEGIADLEFLFQKLPVDDQEQPAFSIDFTLARGLNYYTGIIFEAKAPSSVQIGSIGGGGRYDDLTGLFGVPNIPGVGISFGLDRIYEVLEELSLFPDTVRSSTSVLFFNLGEKESTVAFESMQQLRSRGVACEMFHEQSKFDKQFKYAEKKNIPWVVIMGEKEIAEKNCALKNIRTGIQQIISLTDLYHYTF
jgi:histidyl-tRNA synthetase